MSAYPTAACWNHIWKKNLFFAFIRKNRAIVVLIMNKEECVINENNFFYCIKLCMLRFHFTRSQIWTKTERALNYLKILNFYSCVYKIKSCFHQKRFYTGGSRWKKNIYIYIYSSCKLYDILQNSNKSKLNAEVQRHFGY